MVTAARAAQRWWLLAAALAATPGLPACSQVLDIPDDPRVVATGPWRCLNQLPVAPAASGPLASVRVQACNFITNCTTMASGLTAKLCDKRDVG